MSNKCSILALHQADQQDGVLRHKDEDISLMQPEELDCWDLGRIWRKLINFWTRKQEAGVDHHPERVGGQYGVNHLLTELSSLRSEQSLEIS